MLVFQADKSDNKNKKQTQKIYKKCKQQIISKQKGSKVNVNFSDQP